MLKFGFFLKQRPLAAGFDRNNYAHYSNNNIR